MALPVRSANRIEQRPASNPGRPVDEQDLRRSRFGRSTIAPTTVRAQKTVPSLPSRPRPGTVADQPLTQEHSDRARIQTVARKKGTGCNSTPLATFPRALVRAAIADSIQSRCNLLRFLETLWKRDRLDLELTERYRVSGAGYGDRTRVRGLGSLCTTIVLSPRPKAGRRTTNAQKYITRESAPAPRPALRPSSPAWSPPDSGAAAARCSRAGR